QPGQRRLEGAALPVDPRRRQGIHPAPRSPQDRELSMTIAPRSRSRSAARLAAAQALYQQEMDGTPLPRLLKEFHDHRLGATIEDAQYHEAERDFFDDIVTGVDARRAHLDARIAKRLAEGGSLERLDRPMRAILRAGAYELLARRDVPVGSVIS